MAANLCRSVAPNSGRTFIDLGRSPLSNSFLTAEQLRLPELHYPLHAYVCESCLLVQLEEFETAERIFGDYLYFSSYSDSWLRHCQTYAAHMTEKLALGADSMVVEVASNDGYLLQYFSRLGVGVLGVEPARNVAAVAQARGVPTEVAFFSVATARRLVEAGRSADLICANNVLAHVPDLNDFVEGFKILLKPGGIITVEFPHLLRLIGEAAIRYHLSRTFFLFFSVGGKKRFREPPASTVRRRLPGNAWRLAADPCLSCRRHFAHSDGATACGVD